MMDTNKLTIEEKIKLLSGKSGERVAEKYNLRFPVMKDGPHGVSNHGVCYPNMCLSACSWDKELLFYLGQAIGNDCIEEGVDVILGPSVNLKRNPLCGRNFEYFSEDVCLSGELASAYVNGVQSTGTAACVKHFCAYNQETGRFSQNVFVDEDTLMDAYVRIFKIVVEQSAPQYLMSSYNLVNGTYVSENSHLLQDVLRGLLGYKGVIISDWGGVDYRARSLAAGVNINMPGDYDTTWTEVLQSVENGEIPSKVIDDGVRLVSQAVEKANEQKTKVPFDRSHIRTLTAESMVLLKNDGALPLQKSARLAVVGAFSKYPVVQGGGCAAVKGQNLRTPYEVLCERLGETLPYAEGYSLEEDKVFAEETLKICESVDTVLLFLGAFSWEESEGYDRMGISLSVSQRNLLGSLKRTGKKVISILTNGSVLELASVDENSVAVLECGYAGDLYAEALCDVLFGDVNPSGRLAESYPYSFADYFSKACYADSKGCFRYREGVDVGYKYYLAQGIKTLYPFGYGLSYTTFSYENMQVEKSEKGVSVQVTVKNTGNVDGKTVVQVYLSHGDETRSLCAFEKVFIKAGEEITLSIPVREEYFKRYDIEKLAYVTQNGEYLLEICSDAQTPVRSAMVEKERKFRCTRYTKIDELRKIGNGPELITKYFSECIGRAVVGEEEYVAKFVGRELGDSVFVRNVTYSIPLHLFTSLTFGYELYKKALVSLLTKME